MQDRINELARKHLFCDAHGYYGGRSARIESFAQAIVRECADISFGTLEDDRGEECGSIYGERSAHAIRARFGIAKE